MKRLKECTLCNDFHSNETSQCDKCDEEIISDSNEYKHALDDLVADTAEQSEADYLERMQSNVAIPQDFSDYNPNL